MTRSIFPHFQTLRVAACLLALVTLIPSGLAMAQDDNEHENLLPALRPGPTLSFEEAVEQAHQQNRSLKAIRLDLQTAAQSLKATWAVLLPTLYATASYTLNDHADSTTQNGVTLETGAQNEMALGLQAKMPLIAAQQWLGIDASRSNRELAELTVDEASQTLLYSVAQAYYQSAAAWRLIHVYDSQAKALANHVESATVRYRNGVGSLVDVKQAQTDLVSVQDEQLKAIFALESARDALKVLVGSKKPPMPVEEPPSLATFLTGTSETIALRWDVRQAKKTLETSRKSTQSQWMQFVPTLNATWQWNYGALVPDSMEDTERSRWNLGLVLSVPLFDESFYPALRQKKLAEKQAKLRLDYLEDEATSALAQARRALTQSELLVASAKRKARLADETLSLAQANYVNGTGSALTVIDAQRGSQTAHVELETRRLDLELARLSKLQALGRDILSILR